MAEKTNIRVAAVQIAPDLELPDILRPLAMMLRTAGLRATDIKAGCGKCGACSALSTYERGAQGRAGQGAAA